MKRIRSFQHYIDKWTISPDGDCATILWTYLDSSRLVFRGAGIDGGSDFGTSGFLLHQEKLSKPMESTPPARSNRSCSSVRAHNTHSFIGHPPKLTVVRNGLLPSTLVLNCLPLVERRGQFLQFQSFDEAYIGRLRAADSHTEQHFVSYFTSLIQIKLRSRLLSPDAIGDIRQETFARFFMALRQGRILQPERLGSFVNSICNNVLNEHYRYTGREAPFGDDEGEKELPTNEASALDALTRKQIEEKVREVLGQLSERDRRVIREIFLEERDKDEVCRNLGVDREYLRVLLYRAKQAFKALYLRDMGDEPSAFAEIRGR